MNATVSQDPQKQQQSSLEVLVFTLGSQEYGADILKIQEIRGYSGVTRIANTPDFIKGVTNLRGVIVPIIDLRIKFGLDQAELNEQTVVIVLTVGERVIGVVADGVSDVLALTPDQIKDTPNLGADSPSTEYLSGLGSIDERMLILVDVDKLVSSNELAQVDASRA